jgi:hypothetical protein
MTSLKLRRLGLLLVVGVLVVLALSAVPALASGGHLIYSGATNVATLPSSTGSAAPSMFEFSPIREIEQDAVSAPHKRHGKKSSVPDPKGSPVAASDALVSFKGLDHVDQRTANGGNQFSLEPPDQGLCVGGSAPLATPQVVEPVNDVLRVFSRTGAALSPVIDLNTFFGLPAEIVRPAGPFGPFLSDPKCYFDPETSHYFLTVLELDTNPATGDFTGKSSELIAVSQTSSALGTWNHFRLDTTDDGTNGTPSHPGCPCLGDQPLIGADSHGFFITTNEFPLFANGFNGAQIYALSKRSLESGSTGPVVQFESPPLAENVSYSVQPATSPAGTYETAAGGTEYFLSALDFTSTTDNRIALWAITNTSSLDTASPSVSLTSTVLKSEDYAFPPDATQKDGARPLGTAVGEPLELLAGNDDRMNQVVFANGDLWAGLNTAVGKTDSQRVGIAWFAVNPKLKNDGKVDGKIDDQGYVAVDGQNVLFPSIGVNDAGKGAIAYTLSGPGYYPSGAYTRLDGRHHGPKVAQGPVQLLAAGGLPEDGFTGYGAFGGNGTARWGDYSAAVAGADGTLWLAGEYIAGDRRTANANWSTFVGNVAP